ncbi:glutamate racemase [Neisseriaceae bacterium TC5R-5]|nr:glutamate racemase [Neisseriaceae bacterium TC5R-5]
MFDSGLGGLSVWQAVAAALPSWPITYLADQAYCPYGCRSDDEIAARSLKIGQYLQLQGAQLLLVACNTATTAAISALRQQLSIPVVGIEPAIKPAAAASTTGRIAVLATEATLRSSRMQALLASHAGQVSVLRGIGHGWVEQVEAGDLQSALARQRVAAVLAPLLGENVDHIVLGCTHYPFLVPLIQQLTGPAIRLYDPAEAVARRICSLLANRQPSESQLHRFMTTASQADNMARLLPVLIGQAAVVETLVLH